VICPILSVKDMALSITFYEKLGFQKQMAMPGPDGVLAFAFVSLGKDVMVGLTRVSDVPTTPHVDFMIYVPQGDQLDTYYNQAKARGIAIADDLKTQDWGDRTFTVIDPNGYRIVMSQTVHEADISRVPAVIQSSEKVR